MKLGIVIGIIVVVCIALAVWFFASQQPVLAPAELTTPDPQQQFTDTTNGATGGQFIQLAPTDIPTEDGADTQVTTQSPAPTDTTALAGETVVIRIDENGFTPQTLTVAAGTTVTFVNDGQAKHWPASDVHPTHNVLPEFDSKGGLETGATYSYTFTEVGTWNCHDHLAAANTCTIVVE